MVVHRPEFDSQEGHVDEFGRARRSVCPGGLLDGQILAQRPGEVFNLIYWVYRDNLTYLFIKSMLFLLSFSLLLLVRLPP